jgi:hypothetical protein
MYPSLQPTPPGEGAPEPGAEDPVPPTCPDEDPEEDPADDPADEADVSPDVDPGGGSIEAPEGLAASGVTASGTSGIHACAIAAKVAAMPATTANVALRVQGKFLRASVRKHTPSCARSALRNGMQDELGTFVRRALGHLEKAGGSGGEDLPPKPGLPPRPGRAYFW